MKVSIVTVCLNSEETIHKTIESVNFQTYQNIEHIFIDGGSTDKTKHIIRNNAKRDAKIILQKTGGIYNAMNLGIKNCLGDIVAFLNSDDFYCNNNIIQQIVDTFSKEFKIVYGNISYFNHKKNNESWRIFKPGVYYLKAYSKGWHAPHPAFFIKRKDIRELFDESCEISADYKFMFYHQEILQLKSQYINLSLVKMGQGGTSQKFKNIILGNMNIIKTLNAYYKINKIFFLIKRFIFKLKATF